MVRIEIRELLLTARIGVGEPERSTLQPLSLDISVDLDSIPKDDLLSESFDYASAIGIAQKAVNVREYNLMETLAHVVAREIMEHRKVGCVEVAVRKLNPPVDAKVRDAGVVVRLENRE